MGHKVLAGYVSKEERYGAPMLRVDVPETDGCPEFSQTYGLSAVYCITPVSEDVARLTAESCKASPVSVYTPDLITVERHQEELAQLKRQMARKALSDGMRDTAEIEEDWGGDLDAYYQGPPF